MLSGLAKMFSGRRKERRHSLRQNVRFTLVVVNGAEEIPGIGIDMSLNGCLIATQRPPSGSSLDAILDIGNRKVPVHLNAVHTGTTMRDGRPWTMLGCSFSGVAVDDYDTLVRFLRGTPGQAAVS